MENYGRNIEEVEDLQCAVRSTGQNPGGLL